MSEATLRTYPPPKPNIALYKTKIDDRFETVQSSKVWDEGYGLIELSILAYLFRME